jgi:hypothetical protein
LLAATHAVQQDVAARHLVQLQPGRAGQHHLEAVGDAYARPPAADLDGHAGQRDQPVVDHVEPAGLGVDDDPARGGVGLPRSAAPRLPMGEQPHVGEQAHAQARR